MTFSWTKCVVVQKLRERFGRSTGPDMIVARAPGPRVPGGLVGIVGAWRSAEQNESRALQAEAKELARTFMNAICRELEALLVDSTLEPAKALTMLKALLSRSRRRPPDDDRSLYSEAWEAYEEYCIDDDRAALHPGTPGGGVQQLRRCRHGVRDKTALPSTPSTQRTSRRHGRRVGGGPRRRVNELRTAEGTRRCIRGAFSTACQHGRRIDLHAIDATPARRRRLTGTTPSSH